MIHSPVGQFIRHVRQVVLILGLVLGSPAAALRQPAQLKATFEDDPAQGAPATPLCTIHFEIKDARRSPELAGVVGERAVKPPADTIAWLRAVLGGLGRRGIMPVFDAEAPAQAGAPNASLSLQTAWITNQIDNYSAVVVVAVRAHAGETSLDRTYRGHASRGQYFSNPTPTMQSAMDHAFANVLDALGKDLTGLCSKRLEDRQ